MSNDSEFHYTYSAQQNQEVMAIRKKYMPRQESELEELKRLDHEVQVSGITESISVGTIGCLLFSLGMCLAMRVIGDSMLLGVIVGIIGAAIMIPAYPIYRKISHRKKEKLTPRILQLADRLSTQS